MWQPALDRVDIVEAARAALREVGLLNTAMEQVSQLAHGARRQLDLAMTIAMQPKLLLLDEPMAGMSHHESGVIAELLNRLKQRYTILLVEHDMDLVFALADRITVLVYGKVLVCGTSHVVRNHPDVKTAYLGDQEDGL